MRLRSGLGTALFWYDELMRFLEIEICGLARKFPVVSMGPKLQVASISLLGDVELVEAVSLELVQRIAKWNPEVLVGPETKVVPLLQKISEIMHLSRYVVCRKGIAAYMIDPLVVEPREMRTSRVKAMAINGRDGQYLRGKKTVIIDDVVFTGGSFSMVRQLLDKAGADYVGMAAVFKQGDKFIESYEYLQELPVFATV